MLVDHQASKQAYGTDKTIIVVLESKVSYSVKEVLMRVDVDTYDY